MRRKDKSLAILKANILFEQRNLESKGLIKEEINLPIQKEADKEADKEGEDRRVSINTEEIRRLAKFLYTHLNSEVGYEGIRVGPFKGVLTYESEMKNYYNKNEGDDFEIKVNDNPDSPFFKGIIFSLKPDALRRTPNADNDNLIVNFFKNLTSQIVKGGKFTVHESSIKRDNMVVNLKVVDA
jgi:hypothetical protein